MGGLKSVGLAVLAAMAMAAFLAPGSASATKLCKELVETCPAGQIWEAKTELEVKLEVGKKAVWELGKLNAGVFESSDKIECDESVLTGITTNAGGGEGVPVAAEISDVTHKDNGGNCASALFGSCAITAIAKPWNATIAQSGFLGNGDLKIVEKGTAGSPGFQFLCFESITCVYSSKEILMGVLGGNFVWVAFATNRVFARVPPSSVFCPSAARWNATYESGKPNPLQVSKK